MFTEVIDPMATRVITGWLLGTFVLRFSYALNVSPVKKNSSVSIYATFLTRHSKRIKTNHQKDGILFFASVRSSVCSTNFTPHDWKHRIFSFACTQYLHSMFRIYSFMQGLLPTGVGEI